MYLKAVMTFETVSQKVFDFEQVTFTNHLSPFQKDIEEASNVATQCCDTINRFRRKTGFTESLGRMISKTDYDAYTEEEAKSMMFYGARSDAFECLTISLRDTCWRTFYETAYNSAWVGQDGSGIEHQTWG